MWHPLLTIGLEIARKYVEEGSYVYITGRREAKLAEAASTIGRNVGYTAADVSDKGVTLAVAEKIAFEQGRAHSLEDPPAHEAQALFC